MPRDDVRQIRRTTIILDLGVTISLFLAVRYVAEGLSSSATSASLSGEALLFFTVPPWGLLLAACATSGYGLASVAELARAVVPVHLTGVLVTLGAVGVLALRGADPDDLVRFLWFAAPVLLALRLGAAYVWRMRPGDHADLRTVLIVGSGDRARRVVQALVGRRTPPVRIFGAIDPDPQRVGSTQSGVTVLGTTDAITAILKDHVIDEVIVAVPRGLLGAVEKVFRACEEEAIKVSLMADVFDVNAARVTLRGFTRLPLLSFEAIAQSEWKLAVKRGLDLVLVLLAMPLVLPLMGVIAVAVKLDSPGPVFFGQERVGLGKRRFRMLKIRTMVDGSDRLQAQLEHLNEAQGPVFKIANDPRITRVGRILRRTSLDEIPQLLQVIKGDMSLVGPRPLPLRDVNLFDQGIQRRRFSVRPGLTCLWQISGRSNLEFSKWLELDLLYIENWSLSLDMKILLRTIPAVLRGSGAV
jgi:exopolysaccharide biosynthesis polyprenyl glycosylphosphotransferase